MPPRSGLTCTWIEGDPRAGGEECSSPACVRNGKRTSWCEDHYARVFDPVPLKELRARYDEVNTLPPLTLERARRIIEGDRYNTVPHTPRIKDNDR